MPYSTLFKEFEKEHFCLNAIFALTNAFRKNFEKL